MVDHVLQGADGVSKALEEIVRKMGGGEVSVGFMEGATYPDGTPVAAVAFWNEYGHGGPFPSPPRPFFRNMIAKESPNWPKTMAKLAKAFDYDGPKVLALMGEDIKGALQQSINDFADVELSKTTLMLREIYGNNPHQIRARDVLAAQELVAEGYSGASGTQAHPLIWTGHMLNSIAYEVKE
jgi:hypothetical protein